MKKLTIVLLVLLIIAVTTMVYADSDTFQLNLETTEKSVKIGDTLKINVVLDNIAITSGEKGISGIEGKLTYDTNQFEITSVIPNTNWEVSNVAGSFVANTKDTNVVTSKTTICTFELKAKTSATVGNSDFKLEKIKGSAAETTVEGTTNSLTVKVEESIVTENNGTNGTNTNGTNTNGTNTSKTGTTSTTAKNTTIADATKNGNSMPKTGIKSNIAVLIILLSIIAVISYKKYLKYKKC